MVRKCYATRASLEQRDTEPVFEKPYLFPDGPMGDIQILRSLDKAAAPRGSLEGSDRVQRR
jgi:hypothetical protein